MTPELSIVCLAMVCAGMGWIVRSRLLMEIGVAVLGALALVGLLL